MAVGIIKVDYPEPRLRCTLSPSGIAGTYDGLDRFGRVKDLVWVNYNTSAKLVEIQHGYDLASNRTWREDCVAKNREGTPVYFDECYDYDGLNRLTSLNRGRLLANKQGISGIPAREENWTLDSLGNWSTYAQKTSGTTDLNQTRTYDPANQLTQINSSATNVATDAAGNTTKMPRLGNSSGHYCTVYDAWNRLVEVRAADNSTLIARYEYDGRNMKTVKRIYDNGRLSESRHFYYNNDWQCLEERIELSGVLASIADRQTVWGGRYVDEPILRDHASKAGGSLDERLYVMQDPNWNVVALVDTSGAVKERFGYSAFGKPAFMTDTFANRMGSIYMWDALYTGRTCDLETGLYNYRARPYNAELGRFANRDPIGYLARDLNLYRYVGGNPIRRTDPSGLWMIDVPKSAWKCLLVNEVLNGSSGTNWALVHHWLHGSGTPMFLSMDAFDPNRSTRNQYMSDMSTLANGLSLDCGETKTMPFNETLGQGSSWEMISNYTLTANCTYSGTKTCSSKGCCQKISLYATCNFHAYDYVDFHTEEPEWDPTEGKWKNAFGYAGINIADRLVNECFPDHKNFTIGADSSDAKEWTKSCQ